KYQDLKAKHFLSDSYSSVHARALATRYRTRKSFIEGFTKLHLFVVSLRCDHSCPYCQVSRVSEDRDRYDMTEATADRALELALRTPSPAITIEFQGGEPLLNFPILQRIVEQATLRKDAVGKSIRFVVCTNLSTLSDQHLEFFRRYDVVVSTSLDGPAGIHNANRPFNRGSSHEMVVRNIERVREALGRESVSALMTTTRNSFGYHKEIIDEYVRLDLGSIFMRNLSPYGFALKTASAIGYSVDEFLRFYKSALDYILEINRAGRPFVEAFTTILLRKILTPFPIGFVDLQSPAGAGIGVVVYNYDGAVYASDESRMLAETGDQALRLGHVAENSYEEIFFGEVMQHLVAASCNEALAGCADCVYQPYCGADPVYHYATQGDAFGDRAASGFCKKHMGAFQNLFALLLKEDPSTNEIFWAWMNEASVNEMKLPVPLWLSS
ncbi:MAG TPA: His-Xaa-Ser system radical SAM maturase HxsB, partial [Terriglobales bacterium]